MKTTEQLNQPKQQLLKGTLMTSRAEGDGDTVAQDSTRLNRPSSHYLWGVFTRDELRSRDLLFKERKNYAKITSAFIRLFMNQFTYLERFTSVCRDCDRLAVPLSVIILVYMCLKNPHDTDHAEVTSIVLGFI